MSITSEISRLQNAKASIKTSIENKGVTVPSATTLDGYASLIDSITSGSTGLTYETGTYTPTSDIARPTISFTNSHSEAPIIVCFYDTTGTIDTTTNTNMGFMFFDVYKLWGVGYPYSSSAYRYAQITYSYRSSNTNSISASSAHCSYNSANTGSSSTSYTRYWVDTTSFRPYSNSTSRYWRAGRTYKWIAVWK